jgi:hypothetical protein
MKNISIILLFLILSSCGVKSVHFNSDDNLKNAITLGENYYKKLKQNGEITSYKLISVEDTKVYMGENNDTIKQVYHMIYEVEQDNKTDKILVKLKKTKNKFVAFSKSTK